MCGQRENASAPLMQKQRNNNTVWIGLFVLVIFLNSVACRSVGNNQLRSQPQAAPDLIQINMGKL